MYNFSDCRLCPRQCGADRINGKGFCGAAGRLTVSRVSRHMWEEPCISGTRGSGTVFFSGCQMKCVFCQNRELSFGCIGEEISTKRLAELFLEVQASGVHNINLVTPTHFTPLICEALSLVKSKLSIPVVWNSSGYELEGTLELTRGLVDIFMPDFKYASFELSGRLSGCPDYAEYARTALAKMYSLAGKYELDAAGLMKKGLLVRHLCLPGYRNDSIAVLKLISETVPARDVLLGLMAQYTPDFYQGDDPKLRRRVTSFEYDKVLEYALSLGFEGYMQSPSSAVTGFTPHFTEKLTVDLK